jgi:hypothetical protein
MISIGGFPFKHDGVTGAKHGRDQENVAAPVVMMSIASTTDLNQQRACCPLPLAHLRKRWTLTACMWITQKPGSCLAQRVTIWHRMQANVDNLADPVDK